VSNFDPAKVGGWVDGEPISGLQITKIQSQQVKSVNGDDGSVHIGNVTLGGIKAGKFTEKILHSGPHTGAGAVAVAWDTQLYTCLDFIRGTTGSGLVTITMSNVTEGDRYRLIWRATSPDPGTALSDFTLVFAGGATHVFDGAGDPTPVLPANRGMLEWEGFAIRSTFIRWKQSFGTQNGPFIT
jgi:hypothetical protein